MEMTVPAIRTCSSCENFMVESYLHEGLSFYYCSDACKDKSISKSEQKKLISDGTLYWTDWLDDSLVYVIFDIQYVSREDAEFIQSNFGNPTNRIKAAIYDYTRPVYRIRNGEQVQIDELS